MKRLPETWIFPALLLCSIGRMTAAPGDYDTGFGDGGGLTVSISSGNDYAYGLAIQPGGKIIVAGGSSAGDFSVLRLLANGSPDPAFGSQGKAVHKFGSFELARAVASVADDKILVAGAGLVAGGSRDFAIMRLLSDGKLDPAFGSGGITTTDLQGGFNETVTCMAVDSAGSATLAGSSRGNLALVRYTAAGALDPSFGVGGKVFTSVPGTADQVANAIALQADGKILVAGQSSGNGNIDMLIARYLANGTLDPGFGTGGKLILELTPDKIADVANGVTVLPDGRVLVAGTTDDSYAVLRLTSAGVLDTGFGIDGSAVVGFNDTLDSGTGLAVQGDGKILLTGSSSIEGRDYFGVLRFTAGGKLDLSFAGGAVLTLLTDGSDSARAIAVQGDGRIVIAGDGGTLGARDFGVARYESGGATPLDQWRMNYFGVATNTGEAADRADFDKDGLANILEYAFDQDPLDGSSLAVPTWQFSGGGFVADFLTPASVMGIIYTAEWSTTLAAGSWIPVADTGSGGRHVFQVPVAGNGKLFLRSGVRRQ